VKNIRSILFPTDFSAVANSVFPLALRVAQQFEAEIYALHLASGGDPHVTETSRYEFPKAPPEYAKVRINEIIVPKEGEPADLIMDTASARGCNLILMASHGRSDVAQFFLGRSVAERVARNSKIPTLVVRLFGSRRTTRPVDRLSKVMFATDLTERSKGVLPITASIARVAGAEIETLVVFGEGDVRPGSDRGREILEGFFAEAEAANLLGVVVRALGGVGEAVVEEATAMQTDLIALTTSLFSGGDPKRADAAEFIIRNAPCPVLALNTFN